ncbi:hypothetical protein EV424DRAFT_1548115 [Suillus variegatus]|nr:hypothetical protein EV424DRAFT_1548115 [Suillus variegatus]
MDWSRSHFTFEFLSESAFASRPTPETRGVSGAANWSLNYFETHIRVSPAVCFSLLAQHQRCQAFLVLQVFTGVLVISQSTFEFLPQSASHFSPNTRDARHFWCFKFLDQTDRVHEELLAAKRFIEDVAPIPVSIVHKDAVHTQAEDEDKDKESVEFDVGDTVGP